MYVGLVVLVIVFDALLYVICRKQTNIAVAAADHAHMASVEVSEALAEIKKIRAMYDDEEASAS